MANIQWDSSSINNYINHSLGKSAKQNGFNGLYTLLSDASLIRKGSYHKLMSAYYTKLKDDNVKEDSSSKDKTTDFSKNASAYNKTGEATPSKNTSSVLDELI